MNTGQVTDFRVERTEFVELSTIGSGAIFKDGASYRLSFEGVEGRFYVSGIMVSTKLFDRAVHDAVHATLARFLVTGRLKNLDEVLANQFSGGLFSSFFFVALFGGFPLLFTDFRHDLYDLLDDCTVHLLGEFQCIKKNGFGNKVSAGLDHHRGLAGTCNQQFKIAGLQLFICGVHNELAFNKTDNASCDRIVESNVGNRKRS